MRGRPAERAAVSPVRPTSPDPVPGPDGAGRALLAVALVLVMVQLDGTGVSIATPTIGRELSASLAELQWISASYLLTISATVVLGGWLGDRYGCRPVFLAGTVLFTACSAGCALAGTVGPLLALRVGQGFAAALVLPTSFAILRAAYPGPALARAIGIASGCASVPLVVGPILAGALVSSLGWQGVFLLAVPVGVTGLAATRGAAAPPAGQPHGFDPLGTLLLAAGLGLLTAGLTAVPARGWTAAGSAGLVVAGVALGAAFLAQERRATAPLLPPRVLRSAPLSVALVALLAYAAAFFGLAFFLGLDLQRAQGYGPVAAGVRLLPLTAGLVLAGPLTGTVLSRAGSRVALAGSAAAAAVAFAGYATLPSTTFGWPVAGLFGVLGLSLGGVQVAATHLVVSCAEDGLGGSVSSLQGVAVQTGGAVGIAALGSVLSAAAGSRFMSLTAEDPALAGAADRVAAVAAGVPQARLSLPPGLPEVQATALRAAAAAAYEAGLQTVLGCCAVVLAGCAVLVLAVLRPRTAAALPAPRQT